MASRKVSDKPEMPVQLRALSKGVAGGQHVMMLACRPVDLHRAYRGNCKDAPSLPLMVLLRFGKLWLERNAATVMASFKHFVRSQFGQQNVFVFMCF